MQAAPAPSAATRYGTMAGRRRRGRAPDGRPASRIGGAPNERTASAYAHQQSGPGRIQGRVAAQARRQGDLRGTASGRGGAGQAVLAEPPLPHRRGFRPHARRLRGPPARVHAARHRLLPRLRPQGDRGLARHHPVLPWRRMGERHRGLLPGRLHHHGAATRATRGGRGLPARSGTPVSPGAGGLLRGGPPAVRRHAARRRGRRPRGALRRQRGRQPGRRGVAHGARPRRVCAAHADAPVSRDVQRPRSCDLAVRIGAGER